MGISPQIAAMYLLKLKENRQQAPAKKEQEDPKMTKKKMDLPRAFKRLARLK